MELQGIANRGDFDLKQHQEFSGEKMEIMNPEGKKVLPHVVAEPSQGVERAMLVFLSDAYHYDKERDNVVLRLDSRLSPVKAAVFPIVKKDEKMTGIAREIFDVLKKEWNVQYDEGGSVGRRYARQDEQGTPYCITVDGESVEKGTVTVRDRDSAAQVRVKVSEVRDVLGKLLKGEVEFEKAGEKV
jgi:glycyl-tRNA synthetase